MKNEGEQFLHQKDSKLHTSQPLEHEQARRKRNEEETSQKPADKISDWLKVLERTHTGHRDDPRAGERIKASYHKEYVIKSEDIPESAFLLEQRIARNMGHGTVEITDEFKERKREQIINDQIHSIDLWIDYLTSKDADIYPTWAKYWAFKALVVMGKYEKVESEDGKETARFAPRTKDTVAGFPPFNAAAFAMTVGVMREKLEQKDKPKNERTPVRNISTKLSEEEFKNLLSSESFAKLYAQFLIEQPVYSKEGLQEIRGEWHKYPKGSEPDELVKSLEGYPLEWCIRNSATARDYLSGGDMHVYYSIDKTGEPIIPRLAIRMQENSIAEVRGIASNQNLDPYISRVIQEKLKEFPDGKQYEKKSADMKRLTEIEERHSKKQELSTDYLRFLYQMYSKIQGFGYQEDPRIKEILANRDIKSDISSITGYSKEQISITKEEALRENIKYHYGSLDLSSLTSAEGLKLPETINGSLDLSSLTSAEGLKLPETVNGSLNLSSLTSAEGLKLPETVNGSLYLGSLTSAEGLKLPETVNGSLHLSSLTSAKGLKLPETVNGSLYLSSLTSAKGLKLPETVNGSLHLSSLTSAKGLKLPETINGDLDLIRLTSVEKAKIRRAYPNIRIL